MNEEKQVEFINSLYGKYGIDDQAKRDYAVQAFRQDFDGALSAFYSKYNPEKEIDQDYFDQIKNSYFTQQAQPIEGGAPVYEETVVDQQAPSGFWANLKNSLDNVPEATANSFWQLLNFTDRSIDNAFDVAFESLSGTPQDGASANTEFFLNKINQNKESMLPVKGVLDEGATIPERAAGAINYGVDFARSIISGVATMGVLPAVEQSEGMYLSALEEKAKLEGKNPLQIISDGEDAELEPLLYGAAAALLERAGLKGAERYINGLDSSVFKWLYTNTKEGGTEWVQGLLEYTNEARAKGLSVQEALSEAYSRGFSREGAETFVGSFLGSAGVSAAGRQIRKGVERAIGETQDVEASTVDPVDETSTPVTDSIDPFLAVAATVETGDISMDSLVEDAVKNAIQDSKSREIEERMAQSEKTEVEPVVAPEVDSSLDPSIQETAETIATPEPVLTPEEQTKADAAVELEEVVAKDLTKKVTDKESLKKALYKFLGASPTSQSDVEQVNASASLIDGIIGARAKREGISKGEWYTSRIAGIGVKEAGETTGAETSFLEDGRAVINALTSSNSRDFIREFGKVLQKDLTDQESLALEAEFGINFKEDTSDDSVNQFGRAFESYLETGRVPEGIKGNTATFVRAAFKKMADWLRDVKSSITGEFSTYMSENSKRIFDGIVTGQEINLNDSRAEGKTDTDVSVAGSSIGTKQDTSTKTGTTGEEVVDLTSTQEEVKESQSKTIKVDKDEQISKAKDGKGNVSNDKQKVNKREVSPSERAGKAFEQGAKEFKIKPSGRIEGGDKSFNLALSALNEVANDDSQDAETRSKAKSESERLQSIKNRSEEVVRLIADKKKNIDSAKADAKKDGYDVSKISSAVRESNMTPLGYDNGVFAYLNLETGEVEMLTLSDGKLEKTTEEVYKSEKSLQERKKSESVRRKKAEIEKSKSLEEAAKAKEEVKNANSLVSILVKMKPTPKGLSEVSERLSKVDPDYLDAVAGDGDADSGVISDHLVSYIDEYITHLVPKNSTPKHLASKIKEFDEVQERLVAIINDSTFISEREKTELTKDITSLSAQITTARGDASQVEMNKRFKAALDGKANTVLDERPDKNIQTQLEGFESEDESGSKIKLFIKNLFRGFGIKKKMVVLNLDYFTTNNHPDFVDKSDLEIAGLRSKKIDRIAAIMSKTKLYEANIHTGEYQSIDNSFDGLVRLINESVGDPDAAAFTIAGDDFSLICVSGKNSQDNAILFTHELAHDIQFEVFNKLATSEEKSAIRKDYASWKRSQKIDEFATPTALAVNEAPIDARKEGDFFSHNTSFAEYLAEQTTFWLTTAQKPSTVVEKFFKEFAAKLKEIFLRYQNIYKPKASVAKMLENYFSEMGNRAEKSIIAERDKRSREAKLVAMDAIKFGRIIDRTSADSLGDKVVQRVGESVPDAIKRHKSERSIYNNANQSVIEANSKLEDLYNEYLSFNGLGTFEKFKSEAFRKAEEQVRRDDIIEATYGLDDTDVSNLGEDREDSIGGNEPAVSFQKKVSAPVRDSIINKAISFSDGKFTTLMEFDKIMKSFDKALANLGMTKLTKDERVSILSGTTTGSLAQIKTPLVKELRARKRADIQDVISSLDATPQERANALAEIGLMVASAATLSNADLDKVNRLSLVGIANASQDERTKAIEDGIADAIVKVQKSKVNKEILQTRNKKHIEVDRVALESLQGAKKNADGTYTVKTESGKTITVSVYDINESYVPGTYVVHLGRVRKVTSLKTPSDSLSAKSEAYDTFNRKRTTVEISNQATRSRIANWARNLFIETQGIESLSNIISNQDEKGSFETSLGKMIGEDGFRKASVEKRRQFDEVESRYQDIAMRVFGISRGSVGKKLMDLKGNTRKIKFTDNSGNAVEKEFPISELMTYYSYLAQKDLVSRFKKMEEDFKGAPQDARFWNKSKQDAIIDSLKPEEKAFVNGIVTELMPFVYDKLNVAHRKNFGYDLQVVENYFPVSVFLNEKDSRSSSEMDLDSVKMADFISSVSSKNIKNRIGGRALRPTDFMSTFLGYADRALHYANYVEPMSKVSMLLQNSEYSGFLRNKFGGKVMESIDWALDNISAGRAVNYNRKAYIDMIRNASIGGAFMANLTMIPKQMSSFVTYADKVGYREFAKYYTIGALNIKQKIEDAKGIWGLDFTKDRWKSQGRVSYDTFGLMLDNVEREVRKSNSRRKLEFLQARLSGLLFIPVAIGDIGAVFAGGMPYYNKLKKEAVSKFPSDAAAQKSYIEIKFSELTSRTQQSRDIMDQSKIQTSGSVDSLLTTFMSTPILYGRLLSGGINDLNKGIKNGDKGLIKKGAKTIVMFGLIAPTMFQIASSGGGFAAGLMGMGDDEDEQEKAFTYLVGLFGVSFFQHIPIVYPLLQNMIDKQILDKTFDAGVAAPLDILTKGADSLNDIMTSIKKEEFSFDDPDIQRAINNVLRTVGINYSGVKNIGEAWANFDETIDEDWRLLLGYSPYTLGIEE